MIRPALAAFFALLLCIALLVAPAGAQLETLKQIVPGVWFREGDIKQFGHCNNIVIEMKDYLIVIDANFPSGAKATLDDVRKISSKPVKYVFDTHHHGDHIYGNPVWTQMGAITLAYQGVVEEMKSREPKNWLNAARSRKDVAALNLPAPEPPQQTFTKSPYVLQDPTRRVEFHFFGWAHTRGDGFAYLPKEKVLCTGDAVVNGPYNFVGDGNVRNWPTVIRKAQKLDVKYVLPGHGGSGGKELMEGQLQYLTALYKAVESAVRSGKKLDDLVKMEGNRPVSTTLQLPDSVKNWVGPPLPGQVRDTYQQISSKRL
jgi:cyclase